MTGRVARFLAGVCLLFVAVGARAELGAPPSPVLVSEMEVVSSAPELDGLQMQRPVWAPGDVPRLVHEATDRSRRSLLRVIRFGARPDAVLIPGTRSAQLGALGVGTQRADGGAEWLGGTGFFFVRNGEGGTSAHFWDGVLRDLAVPMGRVVHLAPEAGGTGVLAAMEDRAGLDLFRFPSRSLDGKPKRLTRTPDEVEHSPTPLADGRTVLIGVTQEATRLLVLARGTVRPSAVRPPGELLSLAALPDGRVVAWVRRAGRPHHALVAFDVDTGEMDLLVNDGFLPMGLAPRPAVSPETGRVFYVRALPDGTHPIAWIRPGENPVTVSLDSVGHQEVAVGSYPDASGGRQDWLAVVAVGGGVEGDVTNHLLVGLAPREAK